MSAIEPLCNLIKIDHNELSKTENLILEIELFAKICDGLDSYFKNYYRNNFRLMKCPTEMENNIIKEQLVRYILHDILLSGEYCLSGIAYHAQIPEEILYDVAIGKTNYLSFQYTRRIIEIHRSIRSELYQEILRKTINENNNK